MTLLTLCAPFAALLLHAAADVVTDPSSVVEAAPVPAAAQTLAIRAKHILLGDGNRVENGLLLVEAGKFRLVGPGDVPPGATLIEHAGWVSPGLVAGWAPLGAPAEARELTDAFQEGIDWGQVFDPTLPAVAKALAAGLTSVLLAGNDGNVISGLVPALKLVPGEKGGPQKLGAGALAASMNSSAVNRSRYPTSYEGLIQGLDARINTGTGRLAAAQRGELLLAIDVDDRHEVQRALSWCARQGIKPLLRGPTLAGEMLPQVEPSGAGIVVAPFGLGASGRTLDALLALSKSRVPFAFALGSPEAFRIPAVAALARGADRAALERALWSGAAKLIGAGDRVGLLKAGAEADFVLWSGDPLELESRPEAVYVGGQLVHQAPPLPPAQPSKPERLGVKSNAGQAR